MTQRGTVLLIVAIVGVLAVPVLLRQGHRDSAQEVESDSDGLQVVVYTSGAWRAPDSAVVPADGMQYFAVDVSMINAGADVRRVTPSQLKLEDAYGREYDAGGIGPEPAFPRRTLEPGDSVRGWVTYEAPWDLASPVLVFQLDGFGRTYQKIAL